MHKHTKKWIVIVTAVWPNVQWCFVQTHAQTTLFIHYHWSDALIGFFVDVKLKLNIYTIWHVIQYAVHKKAQYSHRGQNNQQLVAISNTWKYIGHYNYKGYFQLLPMEYSHSCNRLVMPSAMRSFWWKAGTLSLWTGQSRMQHERNMPLRRKSDWDNL